MFPELGELKALLVNEDYITKEDSDKASKESKDSTSFIASLIRMSVLSKPLLGEAIAEYYGTKFLDLATNSPSKDQILKIPQSIAQKNRVVLIKVTDKNAVIVASDQPKLVNGGELKEVFGNTQIKVAYTLPEYIDNALRQYKKPLQTRFSAIIESSDKIAPEIVDEIIRDALYYKSSDIHFEPNATNVMVRFRTDGVLREAGQLPKEQYENVLNRIKVESGMRIDEHYSAQDGSIQRRSDKLNVDLRVSLIPTVNGEKIVFRVLGSYIKGYTLSDVGLSPAHRNILEEYSKKPFGMILSVGPTGSGKTTTLYSILKMLNNPNVNITTVEDPVEYKIDSINQIQVRESSGLSFAKGLRSIVRQDPDIILVGEIRDHETAEISVNAALTGHLLLSTFHANDSSTAVPRMIELGVEPFLLASTLELVVAQRLVRKICIHCKYSITLKQASSHLSKKDSAIASRYFKEGDDLYEGKGCSNCGDTGYLGRTAVFELLPVTPKMRELILSSPSTMEIAKLSIQEGNPTMFEDGIYKTRTGLTTLGEIMRVVKPADI
jgi:type II secretory ATPase GspE/PulE/Tfp pilus assembly ATPase PilB-like protein